MSLLASHVHSIVTLFQAVAAVLCSLTTWCEQLPLQGRNLLPLSTEEW